MSRQINGELFDLCERHLLITLGSKIVSQGFQLFPGEVSKKIEGCRKLLNVQDYRTRL